jgi:23S rRNA G2069 N7-methylase RlmK/C1962 C5-methylase RlmI
LLDSVMAHFVSDVPVGIFLSGGIDSTVLLALATKLGHRGERFDVIILDPPTFSRGNNGRLWQVEQHLEDVILAALDAAAPKCAILLSTNCTKLTPAILEQRARACTKVRRKTADYHRTRTLLDVPAGHGSSTVWMMVR